MSNYCMKQSFLLYLSLPEVPDTRGKVMKEMVKGQNLQEKALSCSQLKMWFGSQSNLCKTPQITGIQSGVAVEQYWNHSS